MDAIQVARFASVVAGLAFTGAVIYTIIKYNPNPWRNLFFGVLAVGLFGLSSDSKFLITLNPDDGIKFEVSELRQQVSSLKEEQSAFLSTLASERKAMADMVESSVTAAVAQFRPVGPVLTGVGRPFTVKEYVARLQSKEVRELNSSFSKFSIIAGPFDSQAEAEEACKRLSGIECAISPGGGG